MTTETQNLITLRDKVFPIVWEMDKQGRVGFSLFVSHCGTYRCLGGWIESIVFKSTDSFVDTKRLSEYFGVEIRSYDWDKLFGGPRNNSLQDRYDYLCKLIDKRLKEELPSGSEICKQIITETAAA